MHRIKILFKESVSSRFRENFINVAKTNAAARVLPLLAAPLITRLYLPADFAAMAIFIATLSLVGSVSTGRLDWSIPNARTSSMAKSLLLLGVGCLLVITAILGITLILIDFLEISWKVTDNLGNFVYLLPIGVFLLGGQYLAEGWFIRSNDLFAVSRARLFESAVHVFFRICLGFFGMGVLGLVSAVILSTAISFILMVKSARRTLLVINTSISLIRIKTAWLRYKREAAWSTLVAAVNASSTAVPIFFLYQFYPAKEVGWYALMVAFAYGPISIFSSALAQSFWAEAASLVRDGKINDVKLLYLQMTRRLLILSIGIILICLAAPWYVGPLLGAEEWSGAGTILLMMAPALVGSLVFSSTNHLVVYRKQKWQFFSDTLNIAIGLLTIILAGRYKIDFEGTILMFSIATLFTYLIRFYLHILANSNYVKEQYHLR